MEEFIGCLTNYDKMLSELKLFCSQTQETILCERLKQLERCRQVVLVSKLASVLVQIQRVYMLSGDFRTVLKINQVGIH